MQLGIPRGFFYYDYNVFVRQLFDKSQCSLVMGGENDYETYKRGAELTVDEACLPVKLFVGQIARLREICDYVLIPRVMKDSHGKWLCPKLLGLPELCKELAYKKDIITTEPLYFNNKRKLKKAVACFYRQVCSNNDEYHRRFNNAYNCQQQIDMGKREAYMDVSWEFTPDIPKAGEIILPNTKKVFLAGHCYNVYDKFANGNIMRKLDELAIATITEKDVLRQNKVKGMSSAHFIKKPYWESVERIIGAALYVKDNIDGIIYLSSFSCGPDSIIIELLREYIGDIPIIVLKLDEHRSPTGVDTRLEAFADLLERRRDYEHSIS